MGTAHTFKVPAACQGERQMRKTKSLILLVCKQGGRQP